MELPILPDTYTPDADALVRAIKRGDRIMARTSAEETELECATCFHPSDHPGVYSNNYAVDVRIPEGWMAPQVIDTIDTFFTEIGTQCWAYYCNDAQWPTELVDELQKRGCVRDDSEVMLLQRYTEPVEINEELQIIPGRAAYKELLPFLVETNRQWHPSDEDVAEQLARRDLNILDEPRIECFLGRLDNTPVGFVTLLTLGQIGVILGVFTLEAYRRKGVSKTLLRHCIDHCTRALFEQVILEVDPANDGAKKLYESIGFRVVAQFSAYKKKKS